MSSEEGHEESEAALADLGGKIRLFVEAELARDARVIPSTDQAHYLLRVMRAKAGDAVRLFNGRAGEWRARIDDVTRRGCALVCEARLLPQNAVPDLWLAFAPIKRTPADYVAQKATELGVARLQPVITHRTVARRVNLDRLRANAIEAAEQSGRLSVPEIAAPLPLDELLQAWPAKRRLVFCDEGGDATPILEALSAADRSVPFGILTGPEGGFDEAERRRIRGHASVLPVTLGPRIMRADTAALAALAVWQAVCGDWR
jgi:16S rRNA (uracil1498-N3)-methyltransferase